MSERSNSLEHKTKVQNHNIELRNQWMKIGALNSRIVGEYGNKPSEEQIIEFKEKYKELFESLGEAIERNFEEGDERVFKWKLVK